MLESFRLGGWGMFPTMLFGVLLAGAALRYAVKPDKRWVPLQVALALLTLSAGGLGFVTGLIETTKYLHKVPPEQLNLIAATGMGESLHNLALAFMLVVVAGLATAIGAARLTREPTALGGA